MIAPPVLRRLVTTALSALLVVPSTAVAAASLVPGVTPLWISAPSGQASACPSAAAITGDATIAAARAAKFGDPRDEVIAVAIFTDALMPRPVVAACDRAAVAGRRFLGPLTGSSGQRLGDTVAWGQRGLVGIGDDDAALRPGDTLELPPSSGDATLDVTVATTTAPSTLRLLDGGPLPTRLGVTGTLGAPVVVLTAADGAERSVAVPVPAPVRQTISARRDGQRIHATFTAAPGTLVGLVYDDTDDVTTVVSGARTSLSVRAGARTGRRLEVFAYDPRTRSATARRCETTRTSYVRCRPSMYGVTPLVSQLTDGLLDASEIAAAGASASGSRAVAARNPTSVPARVTRIATDRGGRRDLHALADDLNGDGVPDGWFQRSAGGATELLVSQRRDVWRTVQVAGIDPFERPVLGDLTGDGRAELRTTAGVIRTDALAAPMLPRRVALGESRAAGPRDLVGPRFDAFGLVSAIPTGGLTDVTGDGRPEILTGEGPVAVYPSEAFPFGRKADLAQVRNLDAAPPGTSIDTVLDGIVGSSDDARGNARRFLSHRRVGDRLFTVTPVDRSKVSATVPGPIELEERRADGTIVAARTFSERGWPILLDVDLASGDALVRLTPPGRCRRSGPRIPVPGIPRPRVCSERVVRVGPDGTVQSVLTVDVATQDAEFSAAFAPDGADADGRVEVVAAQTGGLNPGPLGILTSTTTGTHDVERLPVLDLGGRRRDDDIRELTAFTNAAGARSVVVVTSPVTSNDRAPIIGELLVVAPK